ncbi:MAG: hypothetical protein IT178_01520, partial [Acidobacteria bacterium]|nr:hypothetical protein [Acidobacteriota bacterium]
MRAFRVAAFAALLFSFATTTTAQYAEQPRQLPAVNGYIRSAVQIGNRLFVAGLFTRLSEPTGGAVVVNTTDGAPMPGAFPVFTGNVRAIVPDNLGGYLVGGDFTSAGGQPITRFARVRPDRTIDPSYHLTADGTIYIIVVAHGRIYLGGSFSTINGAPRPGVAALEATTGRLTTFGAGFASSANVTIRRLAVSSNGIYVAGNDASGAGHLWGFDAGTGRMLFDRGLAVNALAATSDRVYVGTYGATRPVFAVDPRTGGDVPWETSLRFVPIYGTYGDYTSVSQLLLDGSRLYLAGYFRTTDGRENLTAIEASSGQAVSWHPSGAPPHSTGLTRVGPAIVTTFSSGAVLYDWRHVAAYHVDTAALDPWDPRPYGSIQAVAAATDGVVIGGDFNGIGGVERGPIASIDLDTGAIEPWTAASLPGGGPSYDLKLITDGTHIIASYGARTLAKIDAVSGALLGLLELDMGSSLLARVAGDRVAVVQSRGDGVPLVTTVSIDDWSRHDLPTAFSATTFVQAMDVAGNQLYLAGTFSSVNGTRRDGLAAVNLDTGALSSWNPAADATAYWLRVAEGRVWVAGRFRRIGGAWRRGVAALDPATGAATTWNPDVPFGTFMAGDDRIGSTSIGGMEAAADGYVYLTVSGTPAASVSGQPVNGIVALSMATGKRLPWSPPFTDWTAIVPGCLLQGGAICYPPAISSPT